MQAWKQKVLEAWPEFHEALQEAEDRLEFWIMLRTEFIEITYGTRDEDALRRYYACAWWAVDGSEDEETGCAAVLNFYEDLLDTERVRQEMHHYVTAEQFDRLKEIWRYGRSEEEYATLLIDLQRFREGRHLVDKVLPRHAFKGISSRSKPKQ